MSTYLLFSPHLDDAVLSCGAQMAVWAELGHRVIVVTVFSAANEAYADHYARRRAEDEKAIRLLGATPLYFDVADAPFRQPHYHNFSTLLLHTTLPDDTRDTATALGLRMQALARELQADALYFPLAAGGHVDHLAVFEASKVFWPDSTPVSYYEDLPYALVPGWSTARWLQHGATLQHALPAGFNACRLQDLPLAFLENYMENAEDLQASETLHAQQTAAITTAGARCWSLGHYTFQRQRVSMAMEYLHQKIAAIRCYASEWPVLFGPGERDIETALHQPCNANDYTEIYWTLNH